MKLKESKKNISFIRKELKSSSYLLVGMKNSKDFQVNFKKFKPNWEIFYSNLMKLSVQDLLKIMWSLNKQIRLGFSLSKNYWMIQIIKKKSNLKNYLWISKKIVPYKKFTQLMTLGSYRLWQKIMFNKSSRS